MQFDELPPAALRSLPPVPAVVLVAVAVRAVIHPEHGG